MMRWAWYCPLLAPRALSGRNRTLTRPIGTMTEIPTAAASPEGGHVFSVSDTRYFASITNSVSSRDFRRLIPTVCYS